jgi:ubiquinone/menaquinone biosynthesis C-methylase UbiE
MSLKAALPQQRGVSDTAQASVESAEPHEMESRDGTAEIQAAYYRQTADRYDTMHNSLEGHEHNVSLAFINAVSDLYHLETFLDVGAGTGRGVEFLASRGKSVKGIEPVAELIEAGERRGVAKGSILLGSGLSLPFADGSVDAVLECGVLHHVPKPEKVIAEMMRVARKAVFLSDSNRFGQGSPMARLVKLALYKANLWNTARYVQTKGKMYSISEGDGLYYSYSVYDSYAQLAGWADKIWLMPAHEGGAKHGASWLHPLLTSSHVLLCAVKAQA